MVAALPIFIVAGWPILGWLTAALIWLGQRAVQAFFGRKIDQTQDQRRVVGLVAGSTMVRAWSAAIVILIVGLQDKKVGLSAVVMVIGLFTVYFASSLLQRVMSGDPGSAKGSNK